MKAIILVFLGFFLSSAVAGEADQYKKIESTYLNQMRDVATKERLPDQSYKRTTYSATFSDEGAIFRFSVQKALLSDHIPFCDMSFDEYLIRAGEKVIEHLQTSRSFQMKDGHLFENQTNTAFTRAEMDDGTLKTVFNGINYPSDSYSLSRRIVNEDGSGSSEKTYYNMNQVVEDTIIDSENVKSDFKPVPEKVFFAMLPQSVSRFLQKFSDLNQAAVQLRAQFKDCHDKQDHCEDIKKQLEDAEKTRLQFWNSLNGSDVYPLRPLARAHPKSRPIPPGISVNWPPPGFGWLGR